MSFENALDAVKRGDWACLSGYAWGILLEERPEFSKYCDWKKLDGFDWA